MKRFWVIISIIITIFLICLVYKLGILDFYYFKVSKEEFSSYSGYYFNQLEDNEKSVYIKIDKAVQNMSKKIFLTSDEASEALVNINKIMSAYFYDNPKCYYLSNQYIIASKGMSLFKYTTLELNYTETSYAQISEKNRELNNAINDILKANVTDEMTDFEKELAIHDALVMHIDYYNYEDINTIPHVKHTAYGALVEKEAVCDGYSKAFKILLEEAGIDSIIINGNLDGTLHAWNIVNLDNEKYHVDVTSDKFLNEGKYVIHKHFNVSDKEISKSHEINSEFILPKCNWETYNYYEKNKYYISKNDDLFYKLLEIIQKQKNSKILELKLDSKYSTKQLVNTLYDLDFNKWYTNKKESIEYVNIQDVYLFKNH